MVRQRDDVIPSFQDFDKPRDDCPTSPCQLSNGFVLPQGKLTPNALFVGGIDMEVSLAELYTELLKTVQKKCNHVWTKTDLNFVVCL